MDQNIIKLYNAIEWHLLYNFMPPFSSDFIVPCIEAIEAMQQDDPDRAITVRERTTVKAWELIDYFRLDDMIKTEAGQ